MTLSNILLKSNINDVADFLCKGDIIKFPGSYTGPEPERKVYTDDPRKITEALKGAGVSEEHLKTITFEDAVKLYESLYQAPQKPRLLDKPENPETEE